jgi:hypothetical protein
MLPEIFDDKGSENVTVEV